MIYPFVKSAGMFQCPSNPRNGGTDYNVGLPNSTEPTSLTVSYAAARYDGGRAKRAARRFFRRSCHRQPRPHHSGFASANDRARAMQILTASAQYYRS